MDNYTSFSYAKKYDVDKEMKKDTINKFYPQFGIELIENPNEKGIDLLAVNGLFGVEVEQGNWYGDFWASPFSKCKARNLKFPTINFSTRKYRYWYSGVIDFKEEQTVAKILEREALGIYTPNNEQNIYVRGNKDRTQMIVIKHDTIKDKDKRILLEYSVGNNFYLDENKKKIFISEPWFCFRREHVQTWNLIDGIYQLEKI
jgi:hypothetical protein